MRNISKIEEVKSKIGSRHLRKLRKYSDKFNRMFSFFLSVNRSGLIQFCGTKTEVYFDPNGESAKECFRLYEDGYYKGGKKIITRHPNVLKSTLIGKKGIGLWFDQWSDGIVDWSFTREEILNEFKIRNIEIPESFITEFDNLISKKKYKRNQDYLLSLKNDGIKS